MNFGFEEEQELLRREIRKFLDEQCPMEEVRRLAQSSDGYSREQWKQLAELGVSGILVPEEHGGSALTLLDAALVAQSLGHSVTPAPFLSSAVMAPVALGALEADDDVLGQAPLEPVQLVLDLALQLRHLSLVEQ